MELITITINNDDFCCYNNTANRSLANHAKTFIKKVNKAIQKYNQNVESREKECFFYDPDLNVLKSSFERSMRAYIKSYERFIDSKTGLGSGAGDSAVREDIWNVCLRIGKKINYDYQKIDELWEKYYYE